MNRTLGREYDSSDTDSYNSDETADNLSDDDQAALAPGTFNLGSNSKSPNASPTSSSFSPACVPKLSLNTLGQSSATQPTIPAIRLPAATADTGTPLERGSSYPPSEPGLSFGAAIRPSLPTTIAASPAAQATQIRNPAAPGSSGSIRLSIPTLNLGGTSGSFAPAKDQGEEPMTSRQPHGRSQPVAASDSASSSSGRSSGSSEGDRAYQPGASSQASWQHSPQPMHLDPPTRSLQQPITIDLLSTAFCLDPATLASPSSSGRGRAGAKQRYTSLPAPTKDDLLESCSQRLGIPSAHLRLFRLQEVTSRQGQRDRGSDDAGSSSSGSYAVAVSGSGRQFARASDMVLAVVRHDYGSGRSHGDICVHLLA